MANFYAGSSMSARFSTCNHFIPTSLKLLLVLLSFGFQINAFADYTIPVGVTTNASSITNISGTLHVYGTLQVTADATFTSPNPIVVILHGPLPGGQMLWSANKTLALPAGSSIIFQNNPKGLIGGNSASAILQIGDVKYAAANDNSNNVLFSFEQINSIGGSASMAPSIGLYCFGDPIALQGNPVTPPGSAFKLSWSTKSTIGAFSANNSSAATATVLSALPVGKDTIISELYVLAGGSNYLLAARSKIPVDVKAKYTWLGVNNNWNDAVNWCPSIPAINTDVTIPAGVAIYPIITTAAFTKNITLGAGASLTVKPMASLQVAGDIMGAGKIDVRNGTFETKGASAQTISGSNFVDSSILNLVVGNPGNYKLTINATGNGLRILESVSFSNQNADLESNGKLVIASTALKTARVAELAAGNEITGNVTVERFITAGRKWRFLSAATTGQSFKQAWQEGAATANANPKPGYGFVLGAPTSSFASLGFDLYAPGGPTVKTYNSTTNSWVGISNTNNLMQKQAGYMSFVIGDRSGTANTTTVARTTGLLNQKTQPAVTVPANTFVAIGNPYASPVQLANINKSNVQDVFYVWDPKLTGSYGLGAYQTITKEPGDTKYTIFPGGGSYGAQLSEITNLESGIAFFIKGGSSAGSVMFEESDKGTGSAQVFFTEGATQRLRANLAMVAATGTTILDATMLRLHNEYSNGVNEEDVTKLTNTSENISIRDAGANLVIDNRKSVGNMDTIHLKMTGMRVQNYQWELIADNMDAAGRMAFLVDNYKQTSTPLNLNGSTVIGFNVENIPGSYAPDRFSIVFNQAVILPVTFTSIAAGRNNDKTIAVQWKVENENSMVAYEVERSLDAAVFTSIATQAPVQNAGGAARYEVADADLAGEDLFYRVKANSFGNVIQYSSIVKVNGLASAASIQVFPNPVEGKQMNIRFSGAKAGNYQLTLANTSGQVVFNKTVAIPVFTSTQSLSLPAHTNPGVYELKLVTADGVKHTQQVIVL